MTEAEWGASTDSQKMFQVFGGEFGKRRMDPRLRRFAVECCRRVKHLITEEVFLKAANAGEAFAEDPRNKKGTIPVMASAASEGRRHLRRYGSSADRHQFRAAMAAVATCSPTSWHAAFNTMREAARAANPTDADSCDSAELQLQAALFRDIFGPLPFRSITISPTVLAWNDRTVKKLAQGIYDERAFDLMLILADALEEAGCTNQDILAHCRQPGEHVRGCWVVDALLGKS